MTGDQWSERTEDDGYHPHSLLVRLFLFCKGHRTNREESGLLLCQRFITGGFQLVTGLKDSKRVTREKDSF